MEQQEATPSPETREPRRSDTVLIIAGAAVVLGGFLYWTGMTMGLYQGSSLLRTASAKIADRMEPPKVIAGGAKEAPVVVTPESRLGAIKVATARTPTPAARQFMGLDPFRDAGRPISQALFGPPRPLNAAPREVLEQRSTVNKTALADGRTHLSITMTTGSAGPSARPAAAPKPAPAKAPTKKAAPKSKPASSSAAEPAAQTVALAGYDLDRRESDRWASAVSRLR